MTSPLGRKSAFPTNLTELTWSRSLCRMSDPIPNDTREARKQLARRQRRELCRARPTPLLLFGSCPALGLPRRRLSSKGSDHRHVQLRQPSVLKIGADVQLEVFPV